MISAGFAWNRPPHIGLDEEELVFVKSRVMDEQAFEYKPDYKPESPYKPVEPRVWGARTGRIVLLYSAAALLAAIGGFILAYALTNGNPGWVLNKLPGIGPTPARAAPLTAGDTGLQKLVRHAQAKPVPDLHFADGEGHEKSLADFKGKVVLLNVWATWCGPCKVEMPTLDALQKQLGGDNFQVLALSVDRTGPDRPRAFLEKGGLTNIALYNDKTGESVDKVEAVGLPVSLILDRQGHEVARLTGPAEWNSPESVKTIKEFIDAPVAAPASSG
jgi:thiol-disulfide isomerase/thioredoxin